MRFIVGYPEKEYAVSFLAAAGMATYLYLFNLYSLVSVSVASTLPLERLNRRSLTQK